MFDSRGGDGPGILDMRPCGRTGLLVELETLQDVLELYAALDAQRPTGVIDLVPAARTVLLHVDPTVTDLPGVESAVRQATAHQQPCSTKGPLIEVPVVYDGADLENVGELTGWGADGVVARHTRDEWTVAFCGFAPGFGYLVSTGESWSVPRCESPRTRVPRGSVALAGEFSGIYPRESPGGWQLIGRTELDVFDLNRDPPALLRPGTRVQFVDAASTAGSGATGEA